MCLKQDAFGAGHCSFALADASILSLKHPVGLSPDGGTKMLSLAWGHKNQSNQNNRDTAICHPATASSHTDIGVQNLVRTTTATTTNRQNTLLSNLIASDKDAPDHRRRLRAHQRNECAEHFVIPRGLQQQLLVVRHQVPDPVRRLLLQVQLVGPEQRGQGGRRALPN